MTTIGRVFGPGLDARLQAGEASVRMAVAPAPSTRSARRHRVSWRRQETSRPPLRSAGALGGILLEHGGNEFVYRGRNGGVDRANTCEAPGCGCAHTRVPQGLPRTASGRRASRTAHSPGVQVRPRVDAVTSHLFRRDVQGGAPHAQGRGEGFRGEEVGRSPCPQASPRHRAGAARSTV